MLTQNTTPTSTIIPQTHAANSLQPAICSIMAKLMPNHLGSMEILRQDFKLLEKSTGEFVWVVNQHTSWLFCPSEYKTGTALKYAEQWLEVVTEYCSVEPCSIYVGLKEMGEVNECTREDALAALKSWA